MPHLRSDRERRAMFAKMNNPNNNKAGSNQPPVSILQRIRQARIKREETKEIKRRTEEQKELSEIRKLEQQAEQEQAKEERETKIAQLKEEKVESRRKNKERLLMLRREKFARSKTGKFLAASGRVVVAIEKKAVQAAKTKKKPKKQQSFSFI